MCPSSVAFVQANRAEVAHSRSPHCWLYCGQQVCIAEEMNIREVYKYLPIQCCAIRLAGVAVGFALTWLKRVFQKECKLIVWQSYVNVHKPIFNRTLQRQALVSPLFGSFFLSSCDVNPCKQCGQSP